MFYHKKLKLISSLLCLFMMSGGVMLSLNSCIKDYDEPYFEKPGNDEKPGDEQNPDKEDPSDEENGDKPGDEGNEGNEGNQGNEGEEGGKGENQPSTELTDNIKNLSKGSILKATAVVSAQNARGLIITDKAGSIYVYNQSLNLSSYPIGTIVEVQGEVTNYGTGLQLDSSAEIKSVGKETFTYPSPVAYTGSMVDAAAAKTENILSTYVSITGQLNISGNYYNVVIDGASVNGSVSYPDDSLKAQLKDGSTYTFTGYFTGISTSGGDKKFFNIVVTGFQEQTSNSGGGNNGGNTGNEEKVEVPSVFSTEPYGYVVLPKGTPEQYKGYTGFNVSYNKDNHTPNYVSWVLTSSEASSNAVSVSRDYWQDTSITGCAPKSDGWSDKGYDRGHMCPAGDQKWSSQAMKDAASMANMCPQLAAYNQGIWEKLEEKEREWAKRYNQIYIITGPVYKPEDTLTVGNAKTRIPSAFFKAFLYYNGENSRAIAYIIPHLSSGLGGYAAYAMSIDDLEKETGYDFFSALPDYIENAIEATYDVSKWQ